jgi:TrmH family RNA methyltransferase
MPVSKAQIKLIQSLKLKKYRQKYRKFVVEGSKILQEVLPGHPHLIDVLYATEGWLERHASALKNSNFLIEELTERELKKISFLKTPQEVLAVLNHQPFSPDWTSLQQDLVLYADGLQDPGNLGTILRIADWFGIRTLLCSPDTVDWQNPKVIQASMGAFLRVQVIETDWETLRAQLPDVPAYATVMEGQNVMEAEVGTNGIVVIGNEGRGIRPSVLESCAHRLSIPRHERGGAESLNAGIATGIILAALRHRQAVL